MDLRFDYLKGECHEGCVQVRLTDMDKSPELTDAKWFNIFLCLREN
jgi:hypothetical protein